MAAQALDSRSATKSGCVLLLLLLAIVPASRAVAGVAPAREGWGFGLGLGPGLGGASEDFAFGTGASLRALYTFNRWVALGVESNVWAPRSGESAHGERGYVGQRTSPSPSL